MQSWQNGYSLPKCGAKPSLTSRRASASQRTYFADSFGLHSQSNKDKNPVLSEDMVYLEDLNDPNFQSPPKKSKGKEKQTVTGPTTKVRVFILQLSIVAAYI